MSLISKELEKSGNWLFRWRSYLPVIMVGLILWALRDFDYINHRETISDHLWNIFCLVVSFFGLGIRIWTIGHTPRRTSGRNTKTQIADSLNTTGIYSVVRNPLYLGNYFIGLGIGLFPHNSWLVIIYTLMFWLYYERIIFAEEAYLNDKFGKEYQDWVNSTPVFIPKVSLYRKASLPFSWKNVLKREYSGFFLIIVVMFVLKNAEDLFAKGVMKFSFEWLMLLGVGFTVWVILRSLKKFTTVLHVEGR